MGGAMGSGWALAREMRAASRTGGAAPRQASSRRGARVLYVINSFEPGGAEHGLATLIENGFFDEHELHVFVFAGGVGPVADRIEAELRHDRVIRVTRLTTPDLWAYAKGAMALVRALVRLKPDAVVLSLKQTNVIGRSLLLAFPRIHCIAFEHIAVYRAHRAEGIYGPLLRLLSSRVDEIWADTTETLEQVGQYYRPRADRPRTVVPLFCAPPGLPKKTDYVAGKILRIAAAGRLVGRKRFGLLIDAVSRLRDGGLAVRLDLYGDGPDAGHLLHLARTAGLGDAVRFHGYRADWQSAAVEADVFVNPSEMEGFCIVAAEAMAVGLPVIATDVGGIRDYGRDGANMVKLPVETDAAGLAAVIESLARDETLRRTLGTAARVDIHANFAPAAIRAGGERAFRRRPAPAQAPSTGT